MNTDPNHILVVTRRADRRIMGKTGESRTVCGAARTAWDLTVKEARAAKKAGTLEQWLRCAKCRAEVG